MQTLGRDFEVFLKRVCRIVDHHSHNLHHRLRLLQNAVQFVRVLWPSETISYVERELGNNGSLVSGNPLNDWLCNVRSCRLWLAVAAPNFLSKWTSFLCIMMTNYPRMNISSQSGEKRVVVWEAIWFEDRSKIDAVVRTRWCQISKQTEATRELIGGEMFQCTSLLLHRCYAMQEIIHTDPRNTVDQVLYYFQVLIPRYRRGPLIQHERATDRLRMIWNYLSPLATQAAFLQRYPQP